MRLQITHLKAPWPLGAVVGDVLDFPDMPSWAAGKCKQVEEPTVESMCAEILANIDGGQVAAGEGEGVGQPIPGIEKPQGPDNVMIGSGLKKPGKHK